MFDQTNLRSVTWTKVSLNEAKIRATPNTSSPIEINWTLSKGVGECMLTFADLGAERDVLGGGALDLLFGRHDHGVEDLFDKST